MRQVVIPRWGDPSVLEVQTAPDPTPGPGEVRVAVEAAGVNFADLMARMGIYPDGPPAPCVVGYEVAGVIDAVGEGVEPDRIGHNVVAMTRFGGYSSSVCVEDIQAVVRPPSMDAVTAAAIPVQGLTAWMMIEEFGRVREGDRVLVHSAGGGVGLMALDMLRYRNAYAIGTASPGKHDMLRERGYDQLVDYRSQDFEAVLAEEEGLDLVLDPIGGDYWAKGLRLLRPAGRLVCFGFSNQATGNTRNVLASLKGVMAVPWLKMNPITLMNENKGVCGVNMGRLWDHGPRLVSWLEKILKRWEDGHIRPVIHATVPFDNASEAHRILHDRENFGKVVLVP